MTTETDTGALDADPLLPELIAELNAPSRERLIEAVRDLSDVARLNGFFGVIQEHADTIKYCMEIGK